MSKTTNAAKIDCLKDWLVKNVPGAFKDRSPKKHIEQSEVMNKYHVKLKHI